MIPQMIIPQIIPFTIGNQLNKPKNYVFKIVPREGKYDGINLWVRAGRDFDLRSIINRINYEFDPAEILSVKLRGKNRGKWHWLGKMAVLQAAKN